LHKDAPALAAPYVRMSAAGVAAAIPATETGVRPVGSKVRASTVYLRRKGTWTLSSLEAMRRPMERATRRCTSLLPNGYTYLRCEKSLGWHAQHGVVLSYSCVVLTYRYTSFMTSKSVSSSPWASMLVSLAVPGFGGG
jgi:hypothetical protein